MQEAIIKLISQYGYISVMMLIAIENIFPPIPSELILSFSGFISISANLNVFIMIIFATLGSLIGAIVLYYLGYLLNKERILKIAEGKTGKLLRLDPIKIKESISNFERHGSKSIFFYRFVPIIRSLISIPAGISRYPFIKFLILTSIGSFIWNTVLIYLGRIMGHNWTLISGFFNDYSWPILIIIIIIVSIIKRITNKNKIRLVAYYPYEEH